MVYIPPLASSKLSTPPSSSRPFTPTRASRMSLPNSTRSPRRDAEMNFVPMEQQQHMSKNDGQHMRQRMKDEHEEGHIMIRAASSSLGNHSNDAASSDAQKVVSHDVETAKKNLITDLSAAAAKMEISKQSEMKTDGQSRPTGIPARKKAGTDAASMTLGKRARERQARIRRDQAGRDAPSVDGVESRMEESSSASSLDTVMIDGANDTVSTTFTSPERPDHLLMLVEAKEAALAAQHKELADKDAQILGLMTANSSEVSQIQCLTSGLENRQIPVPAPSLVEEIAELKRKQQEFVEIHAAYMTTANTKAREAAQEIEALKVQSKGLRILIADQSTKKASTDDIQVECGQLRGKIAELQERAATSCSIEEHERLLKRHDKLMLEHAKAIGKLSIAEEKATQVEVRLQALKTTNDELWEKLAISEINVKARDQALSAVRGMKGSQKEKANYISKRSGAMGEIVDGRMVIVGRHDSIASSIGRIETPAKAQKQSVFKPSSEEQKSKSAFAHIQAAILPKSPFKLNPFGKRGSTHHDEEGSVSSKKEEHAKRQKIRSGEEVQDGGQEQSQYKKSSFWPSIRGKPQKRGKLQEDTFSSISNREQGVWNEKIENRESGMFGKSDTPGENGVESGAKDRGQELVDNKAEEEGMWLDTEM